MTLAWASPPQCDDGHGCYVGESTKREIAAFEAAGKPVSYLSDDESDVADTCPHCINLEVASK